MIIVLTNKATEEDIKKASKEFKSYIKVVADIEKSVAAIGGKFHADTEKILIENGSIQNSLWGGGYDLYSKKVDMQAIINIRPKTGNDSMEILDPEIRKLFTKIVERLFK
jgi:Protein of unknown function (DUF5674)